MQKCWGERRTNKDGFSQSAVARNVESMRVLSLVEILLIRQSNFDLVYYEIRKIVKRTVEVN